MNEVTNQETFAHEGSARGATSQAALLRRIVKLKITLSFAMAGVTLAAYFCYIMVIAFKPGWLVLRLNDHTLVTTGLVAAVGLFTFSAVSAGIYMRIANRRIDPLIQVIDHR